MSIKYAGSDALARMVAKTKQYVEDRVPSIVGEVVDDGGISTNPINVKGPFSIVVTSGTPSPLPTPNGFYEGNWFPIYLGSSPYYASEWGDHPWGLGVSIDKSGSKWRANVHTSDASDSPIEGVQMMVYYLAVSYQVGLYNDM